MQPTSVAKLRAYQQVCRVWVWVVVAAVSVGMIGCEERGAIEPGPVTVGDGSPLTVVREVVAEQFEIKVDAVRREMRLSDFKADELDVVEIVMELEDRLGVEISDERVAAAAGSKEVGAATRMRISDLANLVAEAKTRKR